MTAATATATAAGVVVMWCGVAGHNAGLVIATCLPTTVSMCVMLVGQSGGNEAAAVFNAASGVPNGSGRGRGGGRHPLFVLF